LSVQLQICKCHMESPVIAFPEPPPASRRGRAFSYRREKGRQ
jgi:hypothetical protein